MVQIGSQAGSGQDGLRGKAGLTSLPSQIDLQQNILDNIQLFCLLVDGSQQLFRGNRVDEIYLTHHISHFIGLKVTDKMDLGPIVGVGRQMGGKLLDPVLPAHGDAGGDNLADGIIRLGLGGGYQRDLPRVPPCGQGGLDDGLPGLATRRARRSSYHLPVVDSGGVQDDLIPARQPPEASGSAGSTR